MSCCSNQGSICPCGQFVHPANITNLPGLDAVAYRVGNYTTFRYALLRSLPGETVLTSTMNGVVVQNWRPGAEGDLAVQMMEWWAYLADILTFYNERIANEFFLRTADQPVTVNRLVRLLGYRPRPGMGATGTLAALLSGPASVTLPVGFQIQSKPGPGQSPQIFELDQKTVAAQPDAIPVDPPAVSGITMSGGTITALLKGVISGLKAGDQLLVLEKGWAGADSNYALGLLQTITPGKDPRGNAFTTVVLSNVVAGNSFPASALADGYRLLKSPQSTGLYPYSPPAYWSNSFASTNTDHLGSLEFTGLAGSTKLTEEIYRLPDNSPLTPANTTFVDLQSVVRQIHSGDPVLVFDPTPGSTKPPQLVSVNGVNEVIYYANNQYNPTQPPASSSANPVAGVAMLHTQTSFASGLKSPWNITTAQVAYAWQDVGQLINQPALSVTSGNSPPNPPQPSDGWTADPNSNIASLDLSAAPGSAFVPANEPENALLEDALGNGADVSVSPGNNPTQQATLTINPPEEPPPLLTAPLRLLFNLLPVSRGQTVTGEVLGTGNALVAGQDFTLQKTPVTYFPAAAGAAVSGDLFSSTVQVWVSGIEWTEVPTLYNQPANAQVFITKEDEQGQTHVIFGDGANGARPPTGANIVANYRYGSGATAPAVGTLTNILQPLPGLQAIRNPVAVGGGADPDPPDQVRQLAPRTVLTFARAISVDDYEAIAASTPGVTRAKAEVVFDAMAQRPRVTLWVGDDAAAVANVQSALAGAADPNRQPAVRQATQIAISINATLCIDSKYDQTSVLNAANNALVDPDTGLGLFGVNNIGINQPVYDSQIYAACMVPGVISVKGLQFELLDVPTSLHGFLPLPIRVYRSALSFFRPIVMPECTDHRHDPGTGCYFFLDPANLQLTPE
jgi:hypothetical protein